MNKKILSLVLMTTLTATGLLVQTTSVNAKTIDSKPALNQKNVSEDKVTQSIKIIEKSYLTKNIDGTFSIKSGAEKVVDLTTLNAIKQGMDNVNKLIKDKQLEAKDDLNIKQTSKYNTNQGLNMVTASGTVADLGTIVWHWYGFDVCSNASQSRTMANILTACSNDMKLGSTTGSVVGYVLSGPYGLTITVGTGLSAFNFSQGAAQCSLGAQNGNGSVTYFLGSPSSASFTHAQAIIYV